MGLFDFFKKKNSNDETNQIQESTTVLVSDKVSGKELTIDQASPIVKSMVEQLNYPYRIFSDKMTLDEVMKEYEISFERGKKEGFVPVLIPEDDLLDESFEIMQEDGYSVEETLKLIGDNGKEIFDKRFAEETESYCEEEMEMEELMGEVSGGYPITEFAGLSNYEDGSLKQTILLEIPTKNPWEVVAYVPFGGWNDCPDPEDMAAMCKYWYEKYGAVPVVITHDTLEFILPSPVSESKAMEVAKEHFAFCGDRAYQCTSTGTIGEVADCIRQSKIWYFWWD